MVGHGATSTLEVPAVRAALRQPQSISFLHAHHGSRIFEGQESVCTVALPQIRKAGPAVFVIMPNHVHLLITPRVAVSRLTNGLKGVTAREANSILRSKGKHFWQDESFDHWVRSSREFDRIQAYIEFNPVSAGLANKPEAWPWSSVTRITADFPAQASSSGC
jgi:hypothetical protein